MKANSFFIASYVANWILLAILYLSVFLLYRHFGQRLLRRKEAEESKGPKLNDSVRLALVTLDGTTCRLQNDRGRATVVFFGSPGCSYCDELRPSLLELARNNDDVTSVIVVYGGDVESARRYTAEMPISVRAVADPNQELSQSWDVPGTPYVVVVDADGVVRSKGPSTNARRLRFHFDTVRKVVNETASKAAV
jgi:thioredoxin-related protein